MPQQGIHHDTLNRLQLEYAFGGHDSDATGVFALPCGASNDIPGLAFRTTVSLNNAFYPPHRENVATHSQLFTSLWTRYAPSELKSAFDTETDTETTAYHDQGETETEERHETIDRILNVIEAFKNDPDWSGRSYDLLTHNCNSFTDALAFRLTGQHAPAWLNRAAGIAVKLPKCLVPFDLQGQEAYDDDVSQEEQRLTANLAAEGYDGYGKRDEPRIPTLREVQQAIIGQ